MKQVIIDYLKFHVLVDFKKVENAALVISLFSVLKLDPNKYVVTPAVDGFRSERIYDENTRLRFDAGPSINKKAGVDNFFTLELAGKDCRNFELRGGSWKTIFKWLEEHPTELLRVDIALDDLDGIIPFDEMKDLLQKQHFISSFRSTKKAVGSNKKKICSFCKNFDIDYVFFGVSEEDLCDSMTVNDKTGFTCDFGSKSNLNLQIYDKRVERIVKGAPSNYSQWIRFELRFGPNKAPALFPQLNYAIQFDCFRSFASQLLYGVLDFKEGIPKFETRNHYDRYDTPEWYLKFLNVTQDQEKLKIGSKEVYVPTLEKTIDWFKRSVSKAVMELIGVDPKGDFLFKVMKEGIAEKIKSGKFDNRSYSKIVNYLRFLNKDALSHEDILSKLYLFAMEYIESGENPIDFETAIARNIENRKIDIVKDDEEEKVQERNQEDYIEIDIPAADFEDLFINGSNWLYSVSFPLIGYKEKLIIYNEEDKSKKLFCTVTDLEDLGDSYETGIFVEVNNEK